MTGSILGVPPSSPPATRERGADQSLQADLLLPRWGSRVSSSLLNPRRCSASARADLLPASAFIRCRGVGTIGPGGCGRVSPSICKRQVLFGVSNVGEDKSPRVPSGSRT